MPKEAYRVKIIFFFIGVGGGGGGHFYWSQNPEILFQYVLLSEKNRFAMDHCNLGNEARHEKNRFCLGENKGTDQLRRNCKSDQHHCFHLTDGTIPLLSKPKISTLYSSFVLVQLRLCQTWSETL